MPVESIDKVRFARQVLLDSNFRPEGSLLAKVDSAPGGYILAIHRQLPLENAPPDFDRGYITLLGVEPAFRGMGVGTKLLEAAESFLKFKACKSISISAYAPSYFCPGVDVNAYAAGLNFLLKRGYEEVYRPISMQTSLWNLETPDWVVQRELEHRHEGIAYCDFTPALISPLLEFARTHFPGDWVRVCRETAHAILGGASNKRLQLAIDNRGSEPVVLGFSHFDFERFGPIGVDPNQRGRGIGQVLMYRILRAQRDSGSRVAWFMWSDDRTAERIYSAAGFQITRRFALLKKEL